MRELPMLRKTSLLVRLPRSVARSIALLAVGLLALNVVAAGCSSADGVSATDTVAASPQSDVGRAA